MKRRERLKIRGILKQTPLKSRGLSGNILPIHYNNLEYLEEMVEFIDIYNLLCS
jgi:hypothetical protein